jgi:hypothetical protein
LISVSSLKMLYFSIFIEIRMQIIALMEDPIDILLVRGQKPEPSAIS